MCYNPRELVRARLIESFEWLNPVQVRGSIRTHPHGRCSTSMRTDGSLARPREARRPPFSRAGPRVAPQYAPGCRGVPSRLLSAAISSYISFARNAPQPPPTPPIEPRLRGRLGPGNQRKGVGRRVTDRTRAERLTSTPRHPRRPVGTSFGSGSVTIHVR